MDTVKGVLIILVLLLGGASFLLFIQSQSQKVQVEQALELSAATRELLSAQGVFCSAGPHEFSKAAQCISPLLDQKNFKEDGFAQPDSKGTAGYLVIKNINRRVYASSNFTFLFNREVVQRGCHIPGDIGYDVACRFEFPQRCLDGYVLEVHYTEGPTPRKLFIKNC